MGGDDAEPGRFPYTVSLQRITDEGEYRHYCGGSLVAPDMVLTGT